MLSSRRTILASLRANSLEDSARESSAEAKSARFGWTSDSGGTTSDETRERQPAHLMSSQLLILLGAGAISALFVFLIIRKADRLGLVQAPVARSSHVRPTPTGGGVGIVAGALVAGLMLPGGGSLSLILLLLGFVIALTGLIDDWRPLSARVRLPVQAVAIGTAIWMVGAVQIFAPVGGLLIATVGLLILLVAGVWWINLFNFMDGIDGIAGQQAILMMVSAMLACALTTPDATGTWIWWMMGAVAVASFGFLLFNWPPARIFMGDAGSTFLGFILFASTLVTMTQGWLSLPQWLLFAALFASDATVTLLVRILRGEKPAEAHRSHAYQRLSRRFGGARPVTVTALLLNALVLLPIALLVPAGWAAWAVTVLVYAVLVGIILWAGAGLADQEKASFAAYQRLLLRDHG